MKIATALLVAMSLLAGATAGAAALEATITGTTDYDFRGVSQTADDPAIQGDVNVSGESGWYAGLWASNVDFDNCCDEDYELDWYAGFTAGETLEWDAGIVYYSYPSADDSLNYSEVYLGATYYGADDKWDIGIMQWYSWEWFGYDDYGYYSEINASYQLPWWGIGVTGHYGYTWGDGPDDNTDDSGLEEYADWSVGLTKSIWHLDLDLRYVDTDLDGDLEVTSGAGTNDDRFIFSVSTTFPWE
jgi:uncharacterized protein (TIGR02001 family)